MLDILNKIKLIFKYRKIKSNKYLSELHDRLYKRDKSYFCPQRATLFYFILLKLSKNRPTYWKYLTKPVSNNRVIHHVEGEGFSHHYVVELNGEIYDVNLSLKKPVSVQDYETTVLVPKKGYTLVKFEEKPLLNQDEILNYFMIEGWLTGTHTSKLLK